MKITYNEILNNMNNKFFEYSGKNVQLMSDLGLRFQAIASELYSLYCKSEYVLKQAFVQTAQGEYLDYHAALRDTSRKTATKAHGVLTFSVLEAVESDIDIPSGTVCCATNAPYIQFETTAPCTIAAGNLSVSVSACALANGSSYNVEPNTVTVMVNPPTGVNSVTNADAFYGGCDAESDEALRNRILNSYCVPSTGVSCESMEQAICKIDDVLDANVRYQGDNVLKVFVKTKTNTLSDALKNQITNALLIATLTSCTLDINLATQKNEDLVVYVDNLSGNTADDVKSKLLQLTSAGSIGKSLNLSKLSIMLCDQMALESCEIGCNDSVGGIISCGNEEYIVISQVSVTNG